jgi:hypothetical protein
MTREQQILLTCSRRLIDIARACFENISEYGDGEEQPWDRRVAGIYTLEIYNNVAYLQGLMFPFILKIDNLNKRIEFVQGGFNELIDTTQSANVIAMARGFGS